MTVVRHLQVFVSVLLGTTGEAIAEREAAWAAQRGPRAPTPPEHHNGELPRRVVDAPLESELEIEIENLLAEDASRLLELRRELGEEEVELVRKRVDALVDEVGTTRLLIAFCTQLSAGVLLVAGDALLFLPLSARLVGTAISLLPVEHPALVATVVIVSGFSALVQLLPFHFALGGDA